MLPCELGKSLVLMSFVALKPPNQLEYFIFIILYDVVLIIGACRDAPFILNPETADFARIVTPCVWRALSCRDGREGPTPGSNK